MGNTSREKMAPSDAKKHQNSSWMGKNRRATLERRIDGRASGERKLSLAQKIKMYIKPRLGVDRRKKVHKQITRTEPLLTDEEIKALR